MKNYELTTDSATVGVVIPVYNRKTILVETLGFVLRQTRRPDVLVIVDDGSTDGSADAAEAFLEPQKSPIDWCVIRCKRGSAAGARNVGFEQIKDTDFTAFLDSDDHWPVDFLQRGVEALLADSAAVAATADRRYTGYHPYAQPTDCRPLVTDPFEWFFSHGAGIASCSLFRTREIECVGGWNTSLKSGEDSDLFCQVATLGRWLHLPGAPVVFQTNCQTPANAEAANLSSKHADRNARWATTYEFNYQRLLRQYPERDFRKLRRQLSRRWCCASKDAAKAGDFPAATRCLRRSFAWNWRNLNVWLLWLRLVVRPLLGLRQHEPKKNIQRHIQRAA